MQVSVIVKRKYFTDKSTIGEVEFDDFMCYSLEDTVRKDGEKIFSQTAIPKGKYEIVVNYSNRFGKMMPLLLNVPNFGGVRIHSGNRPDQTAGCILLGYGYDPLVQDQITDSRKAYNDFYDKLKKEMDVGKVYIEIV